jgi:hypothetical protein
MILSKDEMKNCPFCESEDTRLDQDEQPNGIKVWVGWCGNCGCFGPTDLGWSGAVEMWNLRRPYDKLEERRNNLELALNDILKLLKDEHLIFDEIGEL